MRERSNVGINVEQVEYHRNGVSGEPFFVVKFTAKVDGHARNFVATLFPEYLSDREDGGDQYVWGPELGKFYNPRCAVLDADLVGQGVIDFGANSWRGDHYSDELLAAINVYANREIR